MARAAQRTLQQSGDLKIARFERFIYSPAAELKALGGQSIQPSSMKISTRFRTARQLAAAGTIASVALAIGPNVGGHYDGTLAVLTATLIVLIWYTFFTYCLVHRDELSSLKLSVTSNSGERHVRFTVENTSRGLTVDVRLRVLGQRDGASLEMPPSLSGAETSAVSLHPGASHGELFRPSPAKRKPDPNLGPRIIGPDEPNELMFLAELLCMTI